MGFGSEVMLSELHDKVWGWFWKLSPEFPPETMCCHCGRFSPEYLIKCPYCPIDSPDVLDQDEGEGCWDE